MAWVDNLVHQERNDEEDVIHICTDISAIKKSEINVICSNMAALESVVLSKSDREGEITKVLIRWFNFFLLKL